MHGIWKKNTQNLVTLSAEKGEDAQEEEEDGEQGNYRLDRVDQGTQEILQTFPVSVPFESGVGEERKW